MTCLIKIRYVPLDNTFRNTMKRILDVVFALVALMILSPLLLVVAILVKVNSLVRLSSARKGWASTGRNS